MSNTAKINQSDESESGKINNFIIEAFLRVSNLVHRIKSKFAGRTISEQFSSERGDVPGWVLVVLMTTGLVTAIWTIAAPRLSSILRNSLDAMNAVR